MRHHKHAKNIYLHVWVGIMELCREEKVGLGGKGGGRFLNS